MMRSQRSFIWSDYYERTDELHPCNVFQRARDGLHFLANERVDVVFLDIGMPEMNGLEAAEYIQQLDQSICIIFVTAYADHAVEAFGCMHWIMY